MHDMVLPFDPQKEIFSWGPIPGKFFFVSAFIYANMQTFRDRYPGFGWPLSLFLFQNDAMVFFEEPEPLAREGRRVFQSFMMPSAIREAEYEQWQKAVHRLVEMETTIASANLPLLNEAELSSLWDSFYDIYLDFWAISLIPELGNYGSLQLLEELLLAELSSASVRADMMETLTAPEKPSFYQEEEIALAETVDFLAHQEDFFWLQNSYAGTRVLPISFFEERKKIISPAIRTDIAGRMNETKNKRDNMIEMHHLSDDIQCIAVAVRKGIEWQDERKKYIFIALHYQDMLLHEVARRYDIPKEELLNAGTFEVSDFLKGKEMRDEWRKRADGFGILYEHSSEFFYGDAVASLWNVYSKHPPEPTQEKDVVLRGTVVSIGAGTIIEGDVRIVRDPFAHPIFEDGAILVASMTSPEYVFLMKKASAVITDVGGFTSHAAVVSRELGIPCIVNTKRATSLLKDGDRVRLDPRTGIVEKL
ncbi:MAG: hypothetical protein A3C10_01290 [Candidatus Magasanikbacteria bacterium RIFCSPHIGHO2_02_FULL_48_18]|nr:MAG: hypothetical protein A3I74_02115 [Candidatus Magasanikbacteria bacterium RIFCSPLOWO2_02_FULL_47_16]OGH79690.1 MAG: hypothetical protein A3C10_01290 [Candidatus Magasanikbacteria bacterium RIFCSPHIGHO2_02_FULL_48_18]